MNTQNVWLAVAALAFVVGCVATPDTGESLQRAETQLQRLESEPNLIAAAPLASQQAQVAVLNARQATGSEQDHLANIARKRVLIARYQGQAALARSEIAELDEARERLIVRATLAEARRARDEAERARLASIAQAEEARRLLAQYEAASAANAESQRGLAAAQAEAQQARRLADAQAREAELARQEAAAAASAIANMRRQLATLKSRRTDRGLVVTLGDVVFDSGAAALSDESAAPLAELADMLRNNTSYRVDIEGHTDSQGSADANLVLSQRRAEAVRDALIARGVAANRLDALGLGEEFPIADNDTATGRAENRRVEVIVQRGDEG